MLQILRKNTRWVSHLLSNLIKSEYRKQIIPSEEDVKAFKKFANFPYVLARENSLYRLAEAHARIMIPNSQHPFADATGERCAVAEDGRVWYLLGAAGKVDRT